MEIEYTEYGGKVGNNCSSVYNYIYKLERERVWGIINICICAYVIKDLD